MAKKKDEKPEEPEQEVVLPDDEEAVEPTDEELAELEGEEVMEGPEPKPEPESQEAKDKALIAAAARLEEANNREAMRRANKIQMERELRRYIRMGGGFRVGIPKRDERRAKMLMKQLGREDPEWDRSLDPPEAPDHASA
jgi:hypothetical protein